jgi:hypothetical protein
MTWALPWLKACAIKLVLRTCDFRNCCYFCRCFWTGSPCIGTIVVPMRLWGASVTKACDPSSLRSSSTRGPAYTRLLSPVSSRLMEVSDTSLSIPAWNEKGPRAKERTDACQAALRRLVDETRKVACGNGSDEVEPESLLPVCLNNKSAVIFVQLIERFGWDVWNLAVYILIQNQIHLTGALSSANLLSWSLFQSRCGSPGPEETVGNPVPSDHTVLQRVCRRTCCVVL